MFCIAGILKTTLLVKFFNDDDSTLIFVAPIINFRVRTYNCSCVTCLSQCLTFFSILLVATVAVSFDLKFFFL